MQIEKIATIHTDFSEKFGIPRQSGLVEELEGRIVFEPIYRDPSALKGLEGYSNIWLIWGFSEAKRRGIQKSESPGEDSDLRKAWAPTVRPPRLGGDERMGVFATRSPFRPNSLGLSCVRIERIEQDKEMGMMIVVRGADMLDGTPIYDIKPFLPYVDNHPEARGGFSDRFAEYGLDVSIPEDLERQIPKSKLSAVRGVLAQDPRPSYQNDPDRIYGMEFAGMNIRFRVKDKRLTVCEVQKI